MNRRELFAGAGAAALSAAMSVLPVPPQPAAEFTGLTPRLKGETGPGDTTIWVVRWETGTELLPVLRYNSDCALTW